MEKDKKMNSIMNEINTTIEPNNLIIETSEGFPSQETQKIEKERAFSGISDTSSIYSNISEKTLTSEKFQEKQKDLDLPLFTSTKYTSTKWKIAHLALYVIYTAVLFFSSISWTLKKYSNYNTLLMISHFFFVSSNFMLWLYYNRGCLKKANLNTEVKSNVDKSLKARILRSETGWIYFFSLIGSLMLLYANFFHIFISSKKIVPEFFVINFVGTLIISLTQIFKIERALIENREYQIQNDLERSIVEIFLFSGSILFGTTYLVQIAYFYEEQKFHIFLIILRFVGNISIFVSGVILMRRYFCASLKDLNTSDLSAYTL